MFDYPVLDIAISLVFTYLLLAIIVSSFNEWLLNSVFNTRAKDLKSAIENLLFDTQWKAVAGKIIDSPFISSLKKNSGKFPSYIPPKNFVSALLGAVKEGSEIIDETKSIDMGTLRESIKNNSLIRGDAGKVLLGLADRAGDSMENFSNSLEEFFNDAMNRATGWYKRKAKRVSFIVAVVIAFSLNVDTIQITKTLWEQPQLAKAVANIAANNISNIDTTGGRFAVKGSSVSQTDTTIKKSSPAGDTTISVSNKSIRNIQNAKSLFDELPLPVGWIAGNYPGCVEGKFDFLGWLSKFIGLLFTAGAISLGAPFWFDLANKFINVRNSGVKPGTENKKDKSGKNKSDN